MAKQQTITLVFPDRLPDPADLVTRALERYTECTVLSPDLLDEHDDVERHGLIVLVEEA